MIGMNMNVITEIPIIRNKKGITIKPNLFIIIYEIFLFLIRIVTVMLFRFDGLVKRPIEFD